MREPTRKHQNVKNRPSMRRDHEPVAMILFGIVIIIGSLRVGIGWGAEGPKSGFFPFYVALTLIGASLINLIAIFAKRVDGLFAEWSQLGQVMLVVIPTALYVATIPFVGIYVTSIILVTWFMTRIGKYGIAYSLALATITMVAIYLIFENWFLVPLPKGPLEDLLGL